MVGSRRGIALNSVKGAVEDLAERPACDRRFHVTGIDAMHFQYRSQEMNTVPVHGHSAVGNIRETHRLAFGQLTSICSTCAALHSPLSGPCRVPHRPVAR